MWMFHQTDPTGMSQKQRRQLQMEMLVSVYTLTKPTSIT